MRCLQQDRAKLTWTELQNWKVFCIIIITIIIIIIIIIIHIFFIAFITIRRKYEGWNFNSGNYLFTTDTK